VKPLQKKEEDRCFPEKFSGPESALVRDPDSIPVTALEITFAKFA
jgi:hypothetical protein